MKIELIKLKFDDTHSYKYKPFNFCCSKIEKNKAIELTADNSLYNICDADFKPLTDYDDDVMPYFCTSYTEIFTSWEDEFENTENYPIQLCPHCGEKIDISVVEEIDLSDKYNKLSKQRVELWKECRKTDSKKKEFELREKVDKIDKEIDSFYCLDEWKGED